MLKISVIWARLMSRPRDDSFQANMDLVYLVRPGDDNEELRYSLRSVAKNLPHRKIILVGYKPQWVRGVISIPVQQDPLEKNVTSYRNATLNNRVKHSNASAGFAAALVSKKVSDNFVLMNDDFFIMKRVHSIPSMRRLNNIDYYIGLYEARSTFGAKGYYVKTMRQAKKSLRQMGVREIDSYELHVPMIINKHRYIIMRDHIKKMTGAERLHHGRTLYGNFYNIGGIRMRDTKIRNTVDPVDVKYSRNWRFLSTDDDNFSKGEVGEYIRSSFPGKSEYEK
jgi:hypothetical protein